MLVNLKLDEGRLGVYNGMIRENKLEYPDLFCDMSEIESLSDVFHPYKELDDHDMDVLQEDYRDDFSGIYLAHLNANYTIDAITDHYWVRDYESPIFFCDYGVCDNASQALDYFDDLCSKFSSYMEDRSYVILLTPIFRSLQPKNGGWRWHKWGQYIGVHNPQCEYLYDETGIDYVLCFSIVEVARWE